MEQVSNQYYMERPRILAGPYPILDFARTGLIKEFAIKGQMITATPAMVAEKEIATEKGAKPSAENAIMTLLPKDFPGGIKSPHVHYNGDIYLLKKEDWKAFSGKIIEDFRTKLASAKSINYDQLMKLSDVMQEII
jgi:hypothetical protein